MTTKQMPICETLNYSKSDQALIAERQWIDRVNGAPAKRRMWKKRTPHPFPELREAILNPLPPAWVIGAKPRKKKRGRKSVCRGS